MQDGTEYKARKGSSVTVADEHASAIRHQVGGDAGLVGSARFGAFVATKAGRWCGPCRRLWQAWSHVCPRCGLETVPEDEAQ